MRKRGLSAVVTTLIIILLVLVSVGIIWVVVKNIVQQGAEQIELGQFTLDLEIQSVMLEQDNVIVVVVRRNPGEGEFVGMNFVFTNNTHSETIRENVSLAELEPRTFTFTLTELNASSLTSISVYPIYKTSSAQESIGNIADSFEVSESMRSGVSGTGGVVEGNFAALGFTGTGTFSATVSSNPGIYPEFKNLVVDPLDVLVGDNQTFTATVYSPYNVTNVTTRTQLDNEVLFLPLEKISDDGNGTSTWSATWQVYDTHIETYRTNFTAIDSAGNEDSASLTWTDGECGFTHDASSDIVSPCVVTALSGADTSNISVENGVTMTINSGGTVAYSPGNSITKLGTGKIAFAGGKIQKIYLYYTDADGDDYAPSGTYTASTSPGPISEKIRAKNASGITDCNDVVASGGANVYQTIITGADVDHDRWYAGSVMVSTCVGAKSSYWYKDTSGSYTRIDGTDDLGHSDCNDADADIYSEFSDLYEDSDHDYYTTGTVQTKCVGGPDSTYWYRETPPASYKWIRVGDRSGSGDCCDTDSDAHPDQTAFFSNNVMIDCASSFDWNCDTILTKQYTNGGGGCGTCEEIGGEFCDPLGGGTGWSGAVADCGVTKDYYTSSGNCPPEPPCDVSGCNYESRKQACH